MKTGKYYLGIAVAGILCAAALGEVELPTPDTLLGQPEPALAGIDTLYVRIAPEGLEPNSHGLVLEELENSVTNKLKEAGITITETDINKTEPNSILAKMEEILKSRTEYANVKNLKFRHPRIPEFCVDIDALDIENLQQVVFRVQVSLARLVHLEKETRLSFKTDVWQSEPIMQAAPAEGMPAAVTSAVLEQVEAFIHAYLAANPPGKQPADANDINEAVKEQPKPAAEPTPAEYKYVASKNGDVFHRLGCDWAKRIKPENLVGYSNRAKAITSGKRPCKQCKP